MANLTETATWEAGIYQLEETDPVQGGENGIDNLQAKQLANRTAWLKNEIANALSSIDLVTIKLTNSATYRRKSLAGTHTFTFADFTGSGIDPTRIRGIFVYVTMIKGQGRCTIYAEFPGDNGAQTKICEVDGGVDQSINEHMLLIPISPGKTSISFLIEWGATFPTFELLAVQQWAFNPA